MLQGLRDLLSYQSPKQTPHRDLDPQGAENDAPDYKNDMPFLTPESLTFSGVTVIGGTILNFILGQAGGNKLLISAVVAVIFGGFITWLGVTDPKRKTARNKAVQLFLGVVNTALLWIAVFGMTSIGNAS